MCVGRVCLSGEMHQLFPTLDMSASTCRTPRGRKTQDFTATILANRASRQSLKSGWPLFFKLCFAMAEQLEEQMSASHTSLVPWLTRAGQGQAVLASKHCMLLDHPMGVQWMVLALSFNHGEASLSGFPILELTS